MSLHHLPLIETKITQQICPTEKPQNHKTGNFSTYLKGVSENFLAYIETIFGQEKAHHLPKIHQRQSVQKNKREGGWFKGQFPVTEKVYPFWDKEDSRTPCAIVIFIWTTFHCLNCHLLGWKRYLCENETVSLKSFLLFSCRWKTQTPPNPTSVLTVICLKNNVLAKKPIYWSKILHFF